MLPVIVNPSILNFRQSYCFPWDTQHVVSKCPVNSRQKTDLISLPRITMLSSASFATSLKESSELRQEKQSHSVQKTAGKRKFFSVPLI